MKLGNRPIRTPLGLIAAALALAMMFVAGSVGSATASGSDQGVSAASNVAKNAAGKMKSTITGKTADGGKLGGTFTPLKFKAKDGVTQVKGVVDGVITHADGSKSKFTAIRSLEVRKINGQKLSSLAVSAQGAARLRHLEPGARSPRPQRPGSGGAPQAGRARHHRHPGTRVSCSATCCARSPGSSTVDRSPVSSASSSAS